MNKVSRLPILRLSLPRTEYPEPDDAARFYQRLLSELESLPGVTSVGAVSNFPMTDGQSNNGSVLEDFPLKPDEIPPIVRTNTATPGYFETLGIPLHEGRTFSISFGHARILKTRLMFWLLMRQLRYRLLMF